MRIIALATCYNRPAKPIRKRFTDEQSDKLLNIKWWDQSFNNLSEIFKKFDKIEKFLKS